MAPEELSPVYEALNALRVDMATVKAMLGERCTNRGERLDAIETRQEQDGRRISALETSGAHGKGYLAGIIASGGAAGALASLAVKFLMAGK